MQRGGGVVEHKRALRRGFGLAGLVPFHIDPTVAAAVAVLYLAGHGIFAGVDVETAGHVDKEDVAAALVGDAVVVHSCSRLGVAQRLGVGVEPYVLFYPLHEQLRVGFVPCGLGGKLLLKEMLEWTQRLGLDPGRKLVAARCHVVVEHLHGHIAQVLVGESRLDQLLAVVKGSLHFKGADVSCKG